MLPEVDPDQCLATIDHLPEPDALSGESGMSKSQRRTVAIVDDDHAVRDSLRFLLEVSGYLVRTFASAAEFVNGHQEHLACLILDQHMPQMTGLQLAEKLRADGSRTAILLITGSPSPAIIERAALLGIKLLEKPPGEEDVLDFIDAAMP